jgi:hypothetical protein
MIRYPSKAKQTKARVFFAPAHALMKFLSLRTNLCNIYLLLSPPFQNMSLIVLPEGMEKSGVRIDANQLMIPVSWWCRSVDDAAKLMMTVGWWCRLVDDSGQLMMPVSWWCRLVDDLAIDDSSKSKQTKARVFFAPAHALMKFLSLRTNLCNIYLLLSPPFPNMSMIVQPEGIQKSRVRVDANRLMMLVSRWRLSGWWFGPLMMPVCWWCHLVVDAGWLMMIFSWRSFNDIEKMMMLVGWWRQSVDDTSQLMMPVSWWYHLVDELVIDDSLSKQGKANQGNGLFYTSSRTNEVPFIVQHLPTAKSSFSKHEQDSSTRGDREVRGQDWCQSVDDASQLMMLVGWLWRLVDDSSQLMKRVSWWCQSVDGASQLMMPVSW